MRVVNPNILACLSCRRKCWQCRDRIRYEILDLLGEKLFQCTYHEDIDAFERKAEARRMLEWVLKEKIRLENILTEQP